MQVFVNSAQHLHRGRQEMFRGQWVPCVETPERQQHVLDELRRRGLGRMREPDAIDAQRLARVHTAPYLAFLEGAWDAWVALDAGNGLA